MKTTKMSVADQAFIKVRDFIMDLIDKEFGRIITLAEKCEDFEIDKDHGFIHLHTYILLSNNYGTLVSVDNTPGVDKIVHIEHPTKKNHSRFAYLKTGSIDLMMSVLEELMKLKKHQDICRDGGTMFRDTNDAGNIYEELNTIVPAENL